VDFINQTDLSQFDDKASVIEAFFNFAQAEQLREAQELISSENLNADAAQRYIVHSLKREYASENGTELNAMLPKMSPLNPLYLTKKQTVFQKVAAFVEKFKGVGGEASRSVGIFLRILGGDKRPALQLSSLDSC
jgi:type I restriction enzyme R subunit